MTEPATNSDTPGPQDGVVMTPEIASALLGWTTGLSKGMAVVLGAAIGVLIHGEVRCKIWKQNWACVDVELTDEEYRSREKEIAEFVLAIIHDGQHMFDFVSIDQTSYTR